MPELRPPGVEEFTPLVLPPILQPAASDREAIAYDAPPEGVFVPTEKTVQLTDRGRVALGIAGAATLTGVAIYAARRKKRR
jgi:hypothetical protein